MNEIANYIGMLGIFVLASAYVWSFVLASRQSGKWLLGLLIFWPVAYSRLVQKHRALTQGNNKALVIGVALCIAYLAIKMALR